MQKLNGKVLAALSSALLATFTNGARAQAAGAQGPAAAQSGELDEIIVTAERRSSDAQKTSVSVSVRDGEELMKLGRYSLAQILEDVPGVEASAGAGSGSQAGNNITIRGVQSNSGAGGSEITASASTAVYVDDIYEGLGGNYDISRVEILRGPQGTLYGRSATSGVVSMHTRDPGLHEWDGFASVEAGNYDLQHYTAAINAPLGDAWALRVSGNRYERDGYVSAEGGRLDSTAGRAKLLYKPNDAFSLLLGVAMENVDANSGGAYAQLTSPDSTYSYTKVAIGTGTTKYRQYWGKIEWDVGVGTLTYLPALRTIQRNTLTYATAALPIGLYTLTHPVDEPYNHYNTHELRLNSKAGSKLNWQTGVIYFDNKIDNNVTGYYFPSGSYAWHATTDRDSRDLGAFGEATYSIADDWRVTAGLRYDRTRVAIDQVYVTNSNADVSTFPSSSKPTDTIHVTGEAGTRRFNNTTFKARLEHDVTSSNLLYAAISSGFVPGDVQAGIAGNTPATLHTDVFSFGAETLTAFEIGSKNRFLDNRLQINAGVFYYRYGGFQTGGISVCQGACVSFATILVPARMRGAELEVEYQLTPNDHVSLNYGYINAYYVDMPVLYTNSTVWTRPAGIPPQKVNLAYEHIFRLPGDSSISFRGNGRLLAPYQAAGLTGLLSASAAAAGGGAYTRADTETVWDLSATWALSNDRYSVTAYGRNLTNNRYKTNVNVTARGGLSATATPYVPRTYGVVLNAKF